MANPGSLGALPNDILTRAEVLVTGWGTQQVDLDLMQRMPNLRAVVHTGGSVRKVVTSEVLEGGLLVSTQAGTNAEPVADYTHAMVTLSLKGVFRSAEDYRSERKRIEVYDRYRVAASHEPTVGVVGASRIGRSVIARLRSSRLRILVYDPYCNDAEALGATEVDLPELFASSDVVTLHVPGTEETKGMVTAELLALMRDGTTLVNTARGSVVDGEALEAELVSGRIRAILDVTDPLVPSPDSALWDRPNVLLTPHMAGAVGPELAALGAGAVSEVQRYLAGKPMLHLVSAEKFARSA
ncbi:hydroxyacid dehydrogenase [Tessaracoccus rhinocerotis]|uniref:Hydroxyacid dehydrogenase n=1 Tax=Tessaracoccus rhinocerotis TaxID=1689449 RepID=A0A553K0L5_9ACTN|nr:hydroxyacid dehydrogenase [Tessaracoccus rhinocerotis]TRY18238.1 hydroxyacid dehydrogenase [Tessaracoccus rhinocerotis]